MWSEQQIGSSGKFLAVTEKWGYYSRKSRDLILLQNTDKPKNFHWTPDKHRGYRFRHESKDDK